MKPRTFHIVARIGVPAILAFASTACGPQRHMVIAATGTSIGVDISQNPANQSPQAKLGYQRTEVAIVPTNRSAEAEAGSAAGGASNHGDVIMELRYGGIFDMGPSSGIYQRLAVGATAVKQPGAALMFARDADGNLDSTAAAVLQNLETIPLRDSTMRGRIAAIARLRDCHREKVDGAIKTSGVGTYDDLSGYKASVEQLDAIEKSLATLEACSAS